LSPTTSDSTERTFSRPTEIALKLALVAIGPLLLLGVLEGVAYFWEKAQSNGIYAWELVASRRIELVQYLNPDPGYTLMKPGSHYEWQGIPVEINSHGLRDSETEFEKPQSTFRILNLGDSVAMGWGVRAQDTYGKRLEEMLNQQAIGEQHYEVINAGVPGWNLENEFAYLQAEGLKYNPDLIMLDLTIVNDIYGKNAISKDNRLGLFQWLRDNTYFWPFLSIQLRWMEARAQGRTRIDVIDPPTKPSSYFPLDPDSEKWGEIWGWISKINTLANENKAEFVLLLFPLEFQVIDDQYTHLPQDLLMAKATENGIPTVDLLPPFREACLNKPGDRCQLEDRYLFADVWMHPSAYGHEITAIQIKELLDGIIR
jgi:hypothetical protein